MISWDSMGFDGISKNITWDRNKEIFHVNTDAKKMLKNQQRWRLKKDKGINYHNSPEIKPTLR
jgi:hypothetical protein